ncbi:hypothetical protein FHS61_001724 [Altererythrobacter atlanticus]|nr:hypothetical protein [Croceibacterium atlanticum]
MRQSFPDACTDAENLPCKPRAWLDHISRFNPQRDAAQID